MPPKEEDLETNDKFTEMEMEEGSGHLYSGNNQDPPLEFEILNFTVHK